MTIELTQEEIKIVRLALLCYSFETDNEVNAKLASDLYLKVLKEN